VNQILVGAKMFLGTIKDKSPGNADIIRQSIGLVDNAINEIRSLTREQVTPQRQVDLRELIQSLVDNMKRHTDIEASLVYDIGDFVVKDDLKINIYRIVQEGINNILKHAEAQKVSVVVEADVDGLHVVITDDGRGFSSSMAGTRGVGITNILNRVESYNGRVFIESQPGPGCKIDITVPI
jgi:signal transduction histidine kinase